MIGTLLNITKTERIDNNYNKNIIYQNIQAKIIELDEKEYNQNISESEPVQKFSVGVNISKTDFEIGDNIYYENFFGKDIKLKVINNPEVIDFITKEKYIELICKLD